MMAIWQSDIWQGSSGKWYCNNTKNLGAGFGEWFLPARILNLTPAAFINFLLDNFKPDYCYYDEEKNFFSYSWSSQVNANKWKLYINKEARKVNFQI
jgi:hypothetical protein